MSLIRSTNTKLEERIRKALFALGFRYRRNSKRLPGKPDIVFVGRKKVLFIHGCFWHLHSPCNHYRFPKSNVEFWTAKLRRNRERDAATLLELKRLGWKSLVVWECELKNFDAMIKRIERFLA